MTRLFIIGFFLGLILQAGTAAGAEYYVDQSSSCSDTGPGTVTQPFCRIAPAATRAVAGETVHVLAGTYAEQVAPSHSGQSGAPITFLGVPGTIITGIASGYGFKISLKSWIVISGFTVRNTLGHGIYVTGSSFITVSSNDVSYAGQPTSGNIKRGISLGSTTDSLIAANVVHHNTDAGIFLDATSARVTVQSNEVYANARQYARGAVGIDVRGADNLILLNRLHDNEDTGVQSYTGATRNLIAINLVYRNGDRGIDNIGATNQTIIGNTVVQNVTAGINLEAGSTGGIVRNNVSTDNGLGTKGNIRVDSNSISGTTVDYDLVNINTSGVMFVWGSTTYKTLSAFRTATGQEQQGIQANPVFVSPADDNFRLDVGSPAIDSADSGAPGEQAIDLAGAPRVDSPTTVNTGTGPRTFDDRGAYEYQPTALNDYYVDQSSSSCSDTGPGTQTRPFCRIAPAAERAIGGQTVNVLFGTYPEQVTPNISGQSGAPVTFRGSPGTIITGSASGYGFKISGKSWIVVSGFTIRNTVGHGIYIANSSFITVSGNDVSYAGQPTSGYTKRGIYLGSATDSLIASNVVHHNTEAGIYLDAGSARITVENNEAYGNAREYSRGAPAIDLRGADNLILYNWLHDNEDTGVQSYNGATRNLIAMNLAYRNGDHGIDNLGATNQTILGNTVVQNVTAGINLEGGSTGGIVRNNVSIDNGIGSARTKGNIRVDSSSISGTTVDYDLGQISSSGYMFVWGSTSYTTLSAFRTATGQEQHGIQANPLFVSPAGDDYRLAGGSPAIDAADSSAPGEQMFDLAGAPRIDDPATVDTGAGARSFDDRGVYEYQPPPISSASAKQRRKRAQCLVYWTWLSAPTIKPRTCHAQISKTRRSQP